MLLGACVGGSLSTEAGGSDAGGGAWDADRSDGRPWDGASDTSVPGRDGGAADPCEGVDCGARGRCEASGSGAVCRCDPGFEPSGMRCVPEACPAALADRLTVSAVSVAPERVLPRAGGPFSQETPPILATVGESALLAWQAAGGRIRVTPLTTSGARRGEDLVDVEGQELRGFAASPGGFALLFYRNPDAMILAGFDSAGTPSFETFVVGGGDHGMNGAKWIRPEWGDYGRLAYAGGRYAVTFGHTQNWGDRGEHQGDLFRLYDASGMRTSGTGQFEWGCSHSLEVRLVHDGSTFRPICLSDCYPTKAIYLDVRPRSLVLHEEPSGNCMGRSGALLGGAVAIGSTIWVAFVSSEAPGPQNIGLVAVRGGGPEEPIWVAAGSHAQLAPYGEGLLLGWQGADGYRLAELDAEASIVRGPETVSASSHQQTDFVVYESGDVGWAWASGSNEVSVARLRACR